MVHKDDMCAAFKALRSVDRIEILCGMLQLCVPLELRFIGSCLEDLIQKNYKAFLDFECTVNDPNKLNSTEISNSKIEINREFCGTLNMYLSLLHSDNTACSFSLYSILNNLKNFIEFEFQHSDSLKSHEEKHNFIEDVILLFTMASYHPAFTITQRLKMYTISKSLKENLKQTHSHTDSIELHSTLCGNEKYVFETTDENKNFISELSVKDFKFKQFKEIDQLLIQVRWYDGRISECWKSTKDFLLFHSNLILAFPGDKEISKLDLMLNLRDEASIDSEFINHYFKNISVQSLKYISMNKLLLNFIQKSNSECQIMFRRNMDNEMKDEESVRYNYEEIKEDIEINGSITNVPYNDIVLSLEDVEVDICQNDDTNILKEHQNNLSLYPKTFATVLGTSNAGKPSSCTGTKLSNLSTSAHSHGYNDPHHHRSSQNICNESSIVDSSVNTKNNNRYEMKQPKVNNQKSERHHVNDVGNIIELREHVYCDKIHPASEKKNFQDTVTKCILPSSENPSNQMHLYFPDSSEEMGAGDYVIKNTFGSSKFEKLEDPSPSFIGKNQFAVEGKYQSVSSAITTTGVAIMKQSDIEQQPSRYGLNKSVLHETPFCTKQISTIKTVTNVVTAVSNVRVPRPILGASINQSSYHNVSMDDLKVPFSKTETKTDSQTTVNTNTLPRPSSCGSILQHEQEQKNKNFLSEINYSFATNFYTTNYPANVNYIYSSFYNHGLDTCLLPPPSSTTSYNNQLDACLLPPLCSITSYNHLDLSNQNGNPPPSSLTPVTTCNTTINNMSLISPPNISSHSFNLWHHPAQVYLRSNGIVNHRHPPQSFRGSIYLPPFPFDYPPNITPLTLHYVPSLTNVVSEPGPEPTSDIPQPQYCYNCGGFGHLADTCSEPFMVSIGQSAQFKLRSVPKSEASQS